MSEPDKYFEEVLKDAYLAEIENKRTITSNLALPSGVVVLMVGVLWFYVHSMPVDKWDFWSVLFVFFVVIIFLSIVAAVGFLVLVNYNYEYGYMPSGEKIRDFFNVVSQKANQYKKTSSDELADEWSVMAARQFIAERYAEAAERNRGINVKRSGYRHRANTAIIVCLCAFVTSLVPSYILFSRSASDQKVLSVHVANIEDLNPKDLNPIDVHDDEDSIHDLIIEWRANLDDAKLIP